MNIGDLSGGIAMLATVVGSAVLYLRWRSTVVFVHPSIITDLQSHNTILNRDLDEEREKRRLMENELERISAIYEERISNLEFRIKNIERMNGYS